MAIGYDESNPEVQQMDAMVDDMVASGQYANPQQAWVASHEVIGNANPEGAFGSYSTANALAGYEAQGYSQDDARTLHSIISDPTLMYDQYGNYTGGIFPRIDPSAITGPGQMMMGTGTPTNVILALSRIPGWREKYNAGMQGFNANQDDYLRAAWSNRVIADILESAGADAATVAGMRRLADQGGQMSVAGRELDRKMQDTGPVNLMGGGIVGDLILAAVQAYIGAMAGAALSGGSFMGMGNTSGGLFGGGLEAGAGGAMDMGIGFGGDTLAGIGLSPVDTGMLSGFTNAFSGALDPNALAGRIGSSALNQLMSTGQVDLAKLGTSAVTGIGNDVAGKLVGQLDFSLPDFGGVDAPPVGYMSEMDLGGFADMAPGLLGDTTGLDLGSFADAWQPQASNPAVMDALMNPGGRFIRTFNPASPDVSTVVDLQTGAVMSVPNANLDAYGITESTSPAAAAAMLEDAGFAEAAATLGDALGDAATLGGYVGFDAEVPTEDVAPTDNAPAEEAAAEEKAAGKKSPVSAKTILTAAKALLPLLAGDQEASSAARGARRVIEREYANEGERQTAYAEYAAQLLSFLPEIEKLGLDPATLRGAFGEAYVDPETGEVGYRMTAEGQQIYDQMMDAANNALSTALGTDVTKLSEERFNAAMEKLQSKRDADFAALSRALYARGLLGLMTYQEAGVDLLTGQTEAWDLAEGQGANPYMAAYQARVARENADIARGSMNESEAYVESLLNHAGGLLGRGQDIAGGARAALDDLGVYVDENDELKRGKMRGLYSQLVGPGGAYFQRLEGMLPTGRAMAALADVDQAEMAKRLAAYEAAMRALEDRG